MWPLDRLWSALAADASRNLLDRRSSVQVYGFSWLWCKKKYQVEGLESQDHWWYYNSASVSVKSQHFGLVVTSGVSRETSMTFWHVLVQQRSKHHKMVWLNQHACTVGSHSHSFDSQYLKLRVCFSLDSKCPLRVQISRRLGPRLQIELLKTGRRLSHSKRGVSDVGVYYGIRILEC